MPPDIVVDDPGIGQDAALIVVGSLEELERLASYLPESDLSDDVRGADLSQNWIGVVFRGAMPTAGYGVEIETVRLDGDGQVIVEVSLKTPGAEELVAQVVTYPVDVKVVAREGLEDPSDVGWLVQIAEGRVLASLAVGTASSSDSQAVDGEAVPPANDGILDPIPTEPVGEPFRLADIRGTITELETYAVGESASVLVRILVEGAGTDDTVYDKAWIEIVAATQISFDGETFAPPTLDDLATGRQVQVIFIGPVRESYPVQAVARTVLIYR